MYSKRIAAFVAALMVLPVHAEDVEDVSLSKAKFLFDAVRNERTLTQDDWTNVFFLFGVIDGAENSVLSTYGFGDDYVRLANCLHAALGQKRGDRLDSIYDNTDPENRKLSASMIIAISTAGTVEGCAIGMGIKVGT